jgi:hypothetical protein
MKVSRNVFLGVVFYTLFSGSAFAQGSTQAPVPGSLSASPAATPALKPGSAKPGNPKVANKGMVRTKPTPVPPPAAPSALAASGAKPTPAPLPADPPTPWKLSYFGEYVGPRLSNINFAKTQGPSDPAPFFAELDHSVKIAYTFAKNFVLGTQIRAVSPFDPAQNFGFSDLRFYGSINHVIENSSVDIQSVLDVQLPTSSVSRQAGLLVRFNFKNNVTFKTELRNWMFSALFYLSPRFYNSPNNNTDLVLAIYPYCTLDLATNWQLLFEGGFAAAHSDQEAQLDFSTGDPDYVDIGPLWSPNGHLQFNLAPRFYTGNLSFKAAVVYFNMSVSL